MRNRIVTAVKQRFSIRKLSIGAASVLLGTSLYFMGGSATIVHADTPQTVKESGQPADTPQMSKKYHSLCGDKSKNLPLRLGLQQR